jgi:LEA14-like dessication related protein
VVAIVGLLAMLYMLGIVGAPAAGLEDRGDWGEVTDDRAEIVTTVWVNNPNPVGVSLGNTLTAEYDIVLNDVTMAEGSKSDITVPAGNSTEQLRTDLYTDRLPEWWVGYVRNDETIDLTVDAQLTASALATVRHPVTVERTILDDSTPMITALSASANATSGTYTESVETTDVDDSLTGELTGDTSEVTVGYEIERGWATWESVSAEETVVLFHLRVHNPGDVPVPAAPDGVGVAVDTNDVRLLEAQSGEFGLRSVDGDAVIQPGETREVTFTVRMDNEAVDDWFTSHVRASGGPGAEATTVSSTFQVVFEDPATGTTFRLPAESPAGHDCQFATTILVDTQPVETTCGENPVPAGS